MIQRIDMFGNESAVGFYCKYSDVEQLEQERDQLAARVERLEAFVESCLPLCSAEDLLNESPTTSLQAHDKALLLRLADEYKEEHVNDLINRNYVAVWLRAKAEEL